MHGPWVHPDVYTPLVCEGCGELWPGEPLPASPNRYEGWAREPGYVGWNERERRMLAELATVAS